MFKFFILMRSHQIKDKTPTNHTGIISKCTGVQTHSEKIYSKSKYLKLVSGSICETVSYKGNSLGEFPQKLLLACGLPSPGQTSRFFKQREYGDPVPVCHSDQDTDDRQMIFFLLQNHKAQILRFTVSQC